MNYLMYLFCMFIWGLNFIAVKIQGNSVSLEVALLYRSIIALLLFLALLSLIYKKIDLKNINFLTVVSFGLCNFTISYLLLYYGTFYSSAAIVTLIFSMKAIITPVFISVVFRTQVSKRIYFGGILGLLSVFIIIYPDLHKLPSSFYIGVLFALLGTVVTSIGDVLSAYNSQKKTNPVIANVIGMSGAVIFLIVYTYINGDSYSIPTEINFWFGLIYLAVFASFLAWLFYLKLISNIGASESGYMVAMFPAIGGAASVFMGESQLNMNLLIGIVLACIGAYLALRKPKRA
ncbi:TPA: DMT family transporter [Staphylococcus pseudintermedius]|uniref:DMT family transporter n=1 Tax=Staphylococcus intermedius group TaxID=2815305 RepID=UPI0005A0FCC3|nr:MULTISPECIES: DMT family transporter [Staphylococcus intermedius group]ELD8097528.1 DMT family transporter [Staphylococcus pseudintermedius]MCE5499401.1 DMT family transporter [Staphylococcus pseudintermedius]MCE5778799.1 DMT family transporter [Staphylococcus pseudintermedius]MDU9257861.1 DMT family transporter [Staphylococcus pseudintermedius]PCF39203.1 EamA family transporter [Staphylococcus delphini]